MGEGAGGDDGRLPQKLADSGKLNRRHRQAGFSSYLAGNHRFQYDAVRAFLTQYDTVRGSARRAARAPRLRYHLNKNNTTAFFT